MRAARAGKVFALEKYAGATEALTAFPPKTAIRSGDMAAFPALVEAAAGTGRDAVQARFLLAGFPNAAADAKLMELARGADAKKARVDGRALPVGIQANDRDWYRQVSPENRAALDYVLADTMIMGTGPDGKPQRLWLLKEPIADPDAWMERYMAHNLQVLDEPISILANPTYLPTCIAGEYDRLWTEKFLKLAKKMGAKFSFGTNNFNPKPKDLSRLLEVIDWLDLTGDDIWHLKR